VNDPLFGARCMSAMMSGDDRATSRRRRRWTKSSAAWRLVCASAAVGSGSRTRRGR